jgi:hypothetical protein
MMQKNIKEYCRKNKERHELKEGDNIECYQWSVQILVDKPKEESI